MARTPWAPRREGVRIDWAAMQRESDKARAEEALAQERAAEAARASHRVVDPITACLQQIDALEKRVARLEAAAAAAAAVAA